MTFLLRVIAAAVFAVTLGLAGSSTTQAAVLAFHCKPDASGTGCVGSLEIDDAVITGTGTETFDPLTGLLGFTADFGGLVFGIDDDVAFPLFPSVTFVDGLLSAISYLGIITVGSSDASLFITGLTYELTDLAGATSTGLIVSEAPALLVLATGLLLFGGLARRRGPASSAA